MDIITDDRAQGGVGISQFFLSIFVVGSLLYFIVAAIGRPMLHDAQNATTNPTSNQASTYLLDFINLMPVIMLLIGFIGIVLYAVYAREVLG